MLGFSPLSTTPISALPAPPGDINAVLAVTLDDVTVSATGGLAITGQASASLDDATVSSTASLEIAASASITLDDVSLSSNAVLDIAATEATVLDDVTVSATGALLISAELSVTLDDVTGSSDAFLTNHAYLDVTLDDVVLYSDATLRLPNTDADGGFKRKEPKRKTRKDRERLLDQALEKAFEPKRRKVIPSKPWLIEPVIVPEPLAIPEFNPDIANLSGYVLDLQRQLAQRKFELSQMEADDELLLLSI